MARHQESLVFEDDFDGRALNPAVWLPCYLPAWSSRAASTATYDVTGSALHLSIPADQGLWCGATHTPPLRVSGVQSGNYSGPVGSTTGQQPFKDGLQVQEQQETFVGWAPTGGYIELRARAVVTPRSMVAFWMNGLEHDPDESAEICVAEIFGSAVVPGRSAEVGMGVKALRDPRATQDFEAVPLPIDVTEAHTYAVEWTAVSADFYVDDTLVRSCPTPPFYPMQMMLAVFDFPDQSTGDDDHEVPELVVEHLRGYRSVVQPVG